MVSTARLIQIPCDAFSSVLPFPPLLPTYSAGSKLVDSPSQGALLAASGPKILYSSLGGLCLSFLHVGVLFYSNSQRALGSLLALCISIQQYKRCAVVDEMVA
jgi:hypothetical protein